ncbi:putative glycosyl family 92 protein [Diplodia seriata]|uniref:Putative glycosyl family 92 protein n=1 Tax=Diplodia seriata TaxID=420778 RepID=A0A0G2FTK9_9PEZI|nr:putative glycosyl family 92 protein [Diplodia seriata]
MASIVSSLALVLVVHEIGGAALAQYTTDYTQYVDPFHGTENGGNVFPGVVPAPFSVVKLGIDVSSGTTDAYSGYLPAGNVTGFSMLHESGTGGAPKYGVVSQLPVVGDSSLANPLADLGVARGAADEASVGYYRARLANGVTVELAGTDHAGMYRFNATAASSKTFSGNGTTLDQYGEQSRVSGDKRLGGVFTFDETAVSSRVGVSFISSEKACRFLDDELPSDVTLESLVSASRDTWNTQVFSKVTTTETNTEYLTQLYSSLYGMHLIPSNRTGENPLWESDEPYYDDWFTLWDLFRCTTPLMHVLQPEAYEEQIRSFIDIWRNEGFMPDARSSNWNGRVQGGTNADNVLADAYVKGVRGAIDWNEGYALGFSGFVVPRNADGTFVQQDPLSCAGCYWPDPYYEDSPYTYSFNAIHDMENLIRRAGGSDTFVKRLDTFFSQGLYQPGNEPSFTTPYLYNYAGRQDLTVRQIRTTGYNNYSAGRDGIPGNSDAGSLQSWMLWNIIGLYPVTGQTTFLVGSPWFEQLTISLGGGKFLNITSNVDAATQRAEGAYYVQRLTVNGEAWDRAWVTWQDVFAEGGEMAFELGATPQGWDSGDAPPSPASQQSSSSA